MGWAFCHGGSNAVEGNASSLAVNSRDSIMSYLSHLYFSDPDRSWFIMKILIVVETVFRDFSLYYIMIIHDVVPEALRKTMKYQKSKLISWLFVKFRKSPWKFKGFICQFLQTFMDVRVLIRQGMLVMSGNFDITGTFFCHLQFPLKGKGRKSYLLSCKRPTLFTNQKPPKARHNSQNMIRL